MKRETRTYRLASVEFEAPRYDCLNLKVLPESGPAEELGFVLETSLLIEGVPATGVRLMEWLSADLGNRPVVKVTGYWGGYGSIDRVEFSRGPATDLDTATKAS